MKGRFSALHPKSAPITSSTLSLLQTWPVVIATCRNLACGLNFYFSRKSRPENLAKENWHAHQQIWKAGIKKSPDWASKWVGLVRRAQGPNLQKCRIQASPDLLLTARTEFTDSHHNCVLCFERTTFLEYYQLAESKERAANHARAREAAAAAQSGNGSN